MSKTITKIDISTYNENFSDLSEISSLSNKEDVATLVDTFEESGIKGYNIVKILESSGKYIFVYSTENTGFDFFTEINKLSKLDVDITPQNIRLLFGKEFSRGYFVEEEVIEPQTGGIEGNSEFEDAPTGFMGDDDISELSGISTQNHMILFHVKNSVRLPINDSHGIILGRSSSQSEYVIANTRVSRRHARVYKKDDKCMVHDFDSANGTFIDGLRVRSDVDRELLVGSTLLLGDEEFKLM